MKKVKFKVVKIDSSGRRLSVFVQGKYELEYPKYAIVVAKKETLGIAVFRTMREAYRFINLSKLSLQRCKIIHVYPHGRGKTGKIICGTQLESELDNFYKNKKLTCVNKAPLGTIFYPAVEVLD